MVSREANTSYGDFWVAATPIGNLADASDRLRSLLAEATVLLCEDTRVTRRLLSALQVKSIGRQTLVRLDRFSEKQCLEGKGHWPLIEKTLKQGQSVLLSTDAGSPGISDPGGALIAFARKSGFHVKAVPGPSALAAFLSLAGLEEGQGPILFHGFFPRTPGDLLQKSSGQWLLTTGFHVWFESPQRIAQSLAFLAKQEPDLQIVLAKEISKIHERCWSGSVSKILAEIAEEIQSLPKDSRNSLYLGEWVLGCHIQTNKKDERPLDRYWQQTLKSMINNGISPSDAAREVSQIFGISKREVYQASHRKEQ